MIKTFDEFINESDYRNVTGYGTMGGSGDQNTGPSFNKGPDAATYRLPSVVGVESDDISDPYFSGRRSQKRKKLRKHPAIEKNRKDKTKYLDRLEKDTQNKLIENKNDLDPYGEENWDEKNPNGNFLLNFEQRRLQEAEDMLPKIQQYLPNAYIDQENQNFAAILCDADEYLTLDSFDPANPGVSYGEFASNAFEDLEGLREIVTSLKNIGAKNILVASILIDDIQVEEKPYQVITSDTLYFEGISRRQANEDVDWGVHPNELDGGNRSWRAWWD